MNIILTLHSNSIRYSMTYFHSISLYHPIVLRSSRQGCGRADGVQRISALLTCQPLTLKVGDFSTGFRGMIRQGLVNVPFWVLVSHHLQISVGDYIPNSWVMFNWDIYQPLLGGVHGE